MNDDLVLLRDLPPDHPDRNRPLVGCFYRWRGKKKGAWNEVTSKFKIAGNTFNELGAVWVDLDDWCWNPHPARWS